MRVLLGVVTRDGAGPNPTLLDDLDRHLATRDLGRRQHRYFIGVLDPCAAAELTRGCPWDCSFCSAWTFYGRSYRKVLPEAAAEDLARIREPNVFLVDDVAFIQADRGHAVSGHGDVADRVARAHHTRPPSVRRPARGAAEDR